VNSHRAFLLGALALVILAGLGSRLVQTGFPLLDKYPGDALYGVMVYLLLALWRPSTAPLRRGALAMAVMTGLELFQLTGIPLGMVRGGNLGMQLAGRLLGTTFSWADLAAYGVGIGAVVVGEWCRRSGQQVTERSAVEERYGREGRQP
jgi:hypothetical protein